MVTRRRVVLGLGVGALTPLASFAQQPRKVWRIGVLQLASKNSYVNTGRQEMFLQGMREQGYAMGTDFIVEERFADGEVGRLPALTAELVRIGVDLILTSGTQANRAAQQGTTTIPIVTLAEADPVGNGFAVSLARPGKNITGFSTLFAETIVKNFEFLVLAVPKLSRIAVLRNPSNAGSEAQLARVQTAALKVGINVLAVDAGGPEEIERAIATMQRERMQAFIALPDSILSQQQEQIARLALKHRLPSSYIQQEYPEAGGLMSYGQDTRGSWRLGAKFIDRIFKGAKPGDLSFKQPTTFDLVINMKTAQALGIKFPQTILLQVTRVIE